MLDLLQKFPDAIGQPALFPVNEVTVSRDPDHQRYRFYELLVFSLHLSCDGLLQDVLNAPIPLLTSPKPRRPAFAAGAKQT